MYDKMFIMIIIITIIGIILVIIFIIIISIITISHLLSNWPVALEWAIFGITLALSNTFMFN